MSRNPKRVGFLGSRYGITCHPPSRLEISEFAKQRLFQERTQHIPQRSMCSLGPLKGSMRVKGLGLSGSCAHVANMFFGLNIIPI